MGRPAASKSKAEKKTYISKFVGQIIDGVVKDQLQNAKNPVAVRRWQNRQCHPTSTQLPPSLMTLHFLLPPPPSPSSPFLPLLINVAACVAIRGTAR